MRTAIVLAAGLAAASCAGRPGLTPVPQIGRLSSTAVTALDAGVTMMIRTNAWTGQPVPLTQMVLLMTTIENAGTQPLRVRYEDFALVTDTDQRVPALPPSEALPAGGTPEKALPEGVVEPGGRISGFLYFGGIDDPETVRFTANLVNAATGAPFGRIEIPFRVD